MVLDTKVEHGQSEDEAGDEEDPGGEKQVHVSIGVIRKWLNKEEVPKHTES